MSNVQTRLLTSTALAASVIGFLNLPAEAKETELDHGIDKRISSAVTKSDFVEIKKDSNKSSAPKSDVVDLSAIASQIEKKSAPTIEITEAQTKTAAKPHLSADDKARRLNEVGAGHLSAEQIQAEKDRQLGINFEPLVVNNNGILEFSDAFHKIKDVTLLANHYVYCEVKGNVQLAGQALAKLEAMGCKRVGTFSALEGKHLNFGTVAGSVFYNSAENTYFIIWHGTASNAEGWETNFDNQLLAANGISSAVFEIMRDEIVSTLRNEKGLFRAGTEDARINEIMGYVKANLTTDMSLDELLQFKEGLKKLVSDKTPKLANKNASAKEVSMLEKIDAIFAVKMEMLGKKDYIVQELKATAVTALSNKITALDQVIASTKDDSIKTQATEAIKGLKTIIQDVRTNLPKCKNASEVENFMANIGAKIDEELSTKKTLKQKILRTKNPLADLKVELKKELDDIVSARHDQLKRMGKAHELKYRGKAHRGYALKVASAGSQIDEMIRRHVQGLSADLKARARVVITGHSMAGALAKIHAADFDYQGIFGQLPTADNNRLVVHALSAAPTGDYTFAKALERNLGLGNIVDQKVGEDFVPKADPLGFVPEVLKQAAGKIPVAGKELASRLDTDYAPQIGTPAVDKTEDVLKRAEKHFPGKTHSWWNPFGLGNKLVVAPHYGINLGDKQPDGETYGRDAHFEAALARPENTEGWNALLANGGQKATDAFQPKRIKL